MRDWLDDDLRRERAKAAATLMAADTELVARGLCPCGGRYEDLPEPPRGLTYQASFTTMSTPAGSYFVPMAPPGKHCAQCGSATPRPSVVCNGGLAPGWESMRFK